MKKLAVLLVVGLVLSLPWATANSARAGEMMMKSETPRALVETYDTLADTILGAKQTEWNLVHSILATTYMHAEGLMRAIDGKLAAGASVRDEVEQLATLVAQLGNEGDAAVAAVRKRLLEGGHHHNAAGEAQGLYDEGFVIVTREAKKDFLEASKNIAKMAREPQAAALKAEWSKVEKRFGQLCGGMGG